MSYIDVLANDALRNLVMPIPVELYHALSATGVIAERTELIEGVIVRKSTKSPWHAFIANELRSFFEASLPQGYVLRKGDPLTLADSEPEPDLALVKGNRRDFIDHHPNHAELVIEVAISTVALDRQKIAMYAAAAIPEYWLVLTEQQAIEIYRNPDPALRKYRDQTVVTAGQSITAVCGSLHLRDLFS
jgi:Uma2 family endonuclease